MTSAGWRNTDFIEDNISSPILVRSRAGSAAASACRSSGGRVARGNLRRRRRTLRTVRVRRIGRFRLHVLIVGFARWRRDHDRRRQRADRGRSHDPRRVRGARSLLDTGGLLRTRRGIAAAAKPLDRRSRKIVGVAALFRRDRGLHRSRYCRRRGGSNRRHGSGGRSDLGDRLFALASVGAGAVRRE